MDLYENFKTRGESKEAIEIFKHATIDIMQDSYDCYCEAYKACKEDSSYIWKQHSALSAVYLLGFISGARAIRERSRTKKKT